MIFPEKFLSERLLARRIRESDGAALFEAYASDVEATRYLTWRTNQRTSETISFARLAEKQWESGSEFVYTLLSAANGKVAGSARLGKVRVSDDFHFEIGFVLRRDLWGCGLGTELARRLIEIAFDNQSVMRVSAIVDCSNRQSCRVLEKAGMCREGQLRCASLHPNISDIPADVFLYAITRREGPLDATPATC